ncbi:hypothetical protein ASNO1_44470 [Corallococcus caeni]|uniref:Kelch-like protein n=2 Tax=Corallococcus caeni TaxID=3082388 RepID=A0ABQ6QVZ6_9BACT|nr:hypothetical protein ASNO1_44470 [Corallococcus sp. NO1]
MSLCAALVGCAGEEPVVSEPTGSAQIGVMAQELSTSDVSRVELTVTGSGMTTVTTNLDKTGTQWGGVIGNLPAGTGRTFSAKAYNASNTAIYAGEVTNITITAAQTTSVLLLLQQTTAPTPFVNSAPKITGVTVSPAQVEPSKPVNITLTATDADGDTLAYAWTATGGAFGNAAVSNPTWTAPATQGTYTLSATVNDGRGGQAGISIQIAVVTVTGSANVNVTFNTWPVVSQISGTPSGQVATGGVVTLDVSASDSDGDALTYAWTDDCGGVFSGATNKSSNWTAPATAPSSGKCKTKVTVSDSRGGSTTGELTLNVGSLSAPNSVPVIDTTYQSIATVKSSATVRLYVTAHDPENTALTFTWGATGGVLGTPTTTAGRSEVVWTAPTTPQTTTNYTVTVQVQDANGQKKSQDFVMQFPVCTKVVTSVLNRTNPFGVPFLINYQLVGGGGGGSASTMGSKGVSATGSFTLGASEGLDVIVGGGGGFGSYSSYQGGGGGAGYYGGGAGGVYVEYDEDGNEYYSAGGGGGGSSAILRAGQVVAIGAGGNGIYGAGGGSDKGGTAGSSPFTTTAGTAGAGGRSTYANGGTGVSGGTGNSNAGGGGGYGSGGGGSGTGGSSGANGAGSSSTAGQGATNWSTATTLPTAAGAGSYYGGNAGLVILTYDSASCTL